MSTRSTRAPGLADDRRAGMLLTGGIVAGALGTAGLLAALMLLAAAVGDVLERGKDLAAIAGVLIAATGCFVARAALTAAGERLAAAAATRYRTVTRARALRACAERGMPQGPGSVASHLVDGVEALDGYVTRYRPARALAVIGPLMTMVVIARLDLLALVVLLFAGPMLLMLLVLIGSRTRVISERHRQELTRLHARFLDLVHGLGTLKAFGRTEEAAGSLDEANTRFAGGTLALLRTAFQTSLVIEWSATAATALVAVLVSLRVVDGSMAFTTAFTVLVLTPEFFLPLRRLALEYHTGSAGKAALIELEPYLAPTPPPLVRSAPPGAVAPIRVEALTVRYPDAHRDACHALSFIIEAGETVALTGPSGVGKSTVARVLLGLVAPTQGQVTVAGVDITTLDPDAWRARIAWVPQRPILVVGSVADNVRLGAPRATDHEVTAALAAADATAFVAALPDGIETRIGDGGRALSAGQRQRLALARAWLRDAPLVILDEPTAHLDEETELAVLAPLQRFLEERTALLITHREAPLALAHRVVELGAGDPRLVHA